MCCRPPLALASSAEDAMQGSPLRPCAGGDESDLPMVELPLPYRTVSFQAKPIAAITTTGEVLRTARSVPLLTRSNPLEAAELVQSDCCGGGCSSGDSHPTAERSTPGGCGTGISGKVGSGCGCSRKSGSGCGSTRQKGSSESSKESCTTTQNNDVELRTDPDDTTAGGGMPEASAVPPRTAEKSDLLARVSGRFERKPVARVSAKRGVVRKRPSLETSNPVKPDFGDLEDLGKKDSEARTFCSFVCNAPAMCRSGPEGVVEPMEGGGSSGDHSRRKRFRPSPSPLQTLDRSSIAAW